MYGDTTVMRKRSDQLREQGTDIRLLAEQLVAQADGIDWIGRAADSMRTRIHDRAVQLRDAAGFHDSAADSLRSHLGEVDLLKEQITGIEHRVSSLTTDAATRVARLEAQDPDGIRRTPSDEDQELVSFMPPAPGHKDWLTVSLPGL